MNKKEKVILLGKSGSGKDFLMRKLVEKGLQPGLKWTTRPPRFKELHGKTYNFVSEKLFLDTIQKNEFVCYQKFEVTPVDRSPETWYYGITNEVFNKSQVFIMTPGEFANVSPEQRKGCFVVYLDIPRDVRESRLMYRKDKNDSVKRRMDADEEDFKDLRDYDLKITDPQFSADDIYDLME